MTFEEFVSSIGDVIGFEGMAPQQEENGVSCYYLELPDDLVITFMDVPEHGMMLTTCAVGSLPVENREQFMLAMLAANSRFKGASGGILAIDSEREEVVVSRYDYLENLVADDTEQFLESFIADVVNWHERLDKFYDFTEDDACATLVADEPQGLGLNGLNGGIMI